MLQCQGIFKKELFMEVTNAGVRTLHAVSVSQGSGVLVTKNPC